MRIRKLPYLNEAQQEALNAMGELRPPTDEQNRACFLRWREDVCVFLTDALLRFPKHQSPAEQSLSETQEIILDAIAMLSRGLRSFDPQLGKLGFYINRALKMNYKKVTADHLRFQRGPVDRLPSCDAQPEAAKQQEDDNAVRSPRNQSLTVTDEGGGQTQLDVPVTDGLDTRLITELYVQQMAAMILNFKQLYQGHRQGDRRLKYFRMWFSERTKYLTLDGFPCCNLADALRALDYSYLDFFLQEDMQDRSNQTWSRLVYAAPKQTVAVCCSPEPVPVEWNSCGWLPASIPRGYLGQLLGKTPADATVSKQRSAYLNELNALFAQNDLLYR